MAHESLYLGKPFRWSARLLGEAVGSGQISPRQVADWYIQRTRELAPSLNTHLHFDPEHIGFQINALEGRLGRREYLPLAGVPVLIKDNINVQGQPTTCGSRILNGYVSPFSATAVERLVQAGAILFGKTNCDEFGMGSSNEFSAFGPVRNPWNLTRVAGGSSGGSAAAVAADLAPVALGSDTGGSVRQPAAFCGVVGLKPTYGRISRYGLVAYGSSLDQIGPMTRSVSDAALLLDVMSGVDQRDATSRPEGATALVSGLKQPLDLRGRRLGLVKAFFGEGLAPSSRVVLDEAVRTLQRLGAEVVEVDLPHLPFSIAAYYIIATAEASANLARFDGVRYGYRASEAKDLADLYVRSRSEGFGPEVKKRIMLGTFALSSGHYDAYYAKAQRARELLKRDVERAFSQVDLLIAPTAPGTAFPLGSQIDDPLAMYLGDICTVVANLVGIPALSLPCGLDDQGLPVGLQWLAPLGAEASLVRGAMAYEEACGFASRERPSLDT